MTFILQIEVLKLEVATIKSHEKVLGMYVYFSFYSFRLTLKTRAPAPSPIVSNRQRILYDDALVRSLR